MKIRKIILWVCVFSLAIICSFTLKREAYTKTTINSVEAIISDSDVRLAHEGIPHGVPLYYDWSQRPKLKPTNPNNWRFLIAWGQLYEDRKGNLAKNTRIQIRNLRAYYLSKTDNKWHLLLDSRRVIGAAYKEDFKNNINKPGDIRIEPDETISVKAGGGYNFHFWNHKRAEFNPRDVAGLFTTAQARLIVEDPSKPDDRARARYLLSIGGDYWSAKNSKWDRFTTNKDFGIGRFKYVRTNWQAFNLITLPAAEVRRNPPPLD